ncbi:MAG: acyltransferase [Deltaproteobacteria bacterium]|nr:acyltransferase [Deltaproteobacteria bacterium]
MADRAPARAARLDWIDATRGFSILWVAWFHFFVTWANGRLPWPFNPAYFSLYTDSCSPQTTLDRMGCTAQSLFVAFSQLGSQAVAVFVLLSGLGLTYALGTSARPASGWRVWYRQRLLRLFPMYWAAHLVWLVSPFVARTDPVDWRFLASLAGDRVWPPGLFYYANPAWWFFGLIVQLYLVYPLLAALLHRLGPALFLAAAAAFTVASRWLLLDVIEANGIFVQGAFFGSRLWEFAAGMSLALLLRRHRARTLAWLLGLPGLLAGAALYTAGFLSYRPGPSFTCTDGLVGMGLFALLAHLARALLVLPGLRRPLLFLGAYSYGFYLLHQPYVLWAGERLRDLSLGPFVLAGGLVLVFLAWGSGLLERVVNGLARRALGVPPREGGHPAQGAAR